MILCFLTLEAKEIMKIKYRKEIGNDSSEYNNVGLRWLEKTKSGGIALIAQRRNFPGFRYIEFDKNFNELKYEIRNPKYPNGEEAIDGEPYYFTKEGKALFYIDGNYFTSEDIGETTKIAPSNEILKNQMSNGEFKENDKYLCFVKYQLLLLFDKDFNFIDSVSFPDSMKDVKTDYFSFFESAIGKNDKMLFYVAVFRKGAQKYRTYAMAEYDIKSQKWNLTPTINGAGSICVIDENIFFGNAGLDRELLRFDKDSSKWILNKKLVSTANHITEIAGKIYYSNPLHIGYSKDKGKIWDSIEVEKGDMQQFVSFFKEIDNEIYLNTYGEYYSIRKLENVSSVEENTSPIQAQIQAKAIVTNGRPTQITISNVLGKTLTFTTLEEANNYLLEAKGLMLIKLHFADKEATYLKHYFE